MKISIEVDEKYVDEEVVIHCNELNEKVCLIQNMLLEIENKKKTIECFNNGKIFYVLIDDILFFETNAGKIDVHTEKDIFEAEYKLYQLEELLPGYFIRVSKSAILNTRKIYSITKNLTSSSIVEFQNSYKKVYVSRYYFKVLKELMEKKF